MEAEKLAQWQRRDEDKTWEKELGSLTLLCPLLTSQVMGSEMEINRAPVVAQQVKNPTRIYEDVGSIPSPSQWVRDPVLPQAVA